MRFLLSLAAACLIAAAPAATPAFAQQGFGPIDPAQPTGITVAQIIQRMGARETAFKQALEDYTFTRSVKMNTISDETGKPDGEYQQVTDISFTPGGKRYEHVVFAPQNTLERVIMTEADIDEIAHRQPFILTTEELPEYTLTYVGKQHVDELETYVFDAAPKQLVKGQKYFQGRAWVDTQDMEIVLVNGTTVPQDTRRGHEDLQPPFTTYYQQIDGKYWFPTYTKAEGTLHFAAANGSLSQDVHMRNVVRYTDYKRFHTSVTIHYGNEVLPNLPAQPQKPPDDKTPPSPKPPSF